MYPDLAKTYDCLLYPFFLDGIVMNQSLNLPDGMHPNAKGVAEVTKRFLPKAEELIARVQARKAAASKG